MGKQKPKTKKHKPKKKDGEVKTLGPQTPPTDPKGGGTR